MVFVFAIGNTFVNAKQSGETKTMAEEFGCAGDCVQSAKDRYGFIAFMAGIDEMTAYKALYYDCYYDNCA